MGEDPQSKCFPNMTMAGSAEWTLAAGRRLHILRGCGMLVSSLAKGGAHMSVERVREYLKQYGLEGRVKEFSVSSATVELAAQAVGVEAARIAKTLSFHLGEGCVLVVAAGDARIDNRKFKETFHTKAKMLTADEALAMTGLTFPIYIGAMIAAACMRNIGEFTHKFTTHMGEINDIGGISLSLFLGIAMITLKLWQLAALALPLIILLAGQTLLIFLFTYFVIFNIMGRDYDAAVIAAGVCGFGMGATPNAMANMQALCEKYAPSVKAYLLIPLVGSLFADFLNSLVITFFINFI